MLLSPNCEHFSLSYGIILIVATWRIHEFGDHNMASINIREIRIQDEIFVLSKREIEVLELISEGKSSIEIAEVLFVSKRTIDFHTYMIYSKLNVSNRIQAIRYAIKHGIIGHSK